MFPDKLILPSSLSPSLPRSQKHRGKVLLPAAVPVDRISPLIKHPGVLMLTDQRLYFQPAELNKVVSPPLAILTSFLSFTPK